MNNWKTTTLGILTIVGAIVSAGTSLLQGHPVNVPVLFAGITGGWGLIHAADSK